MKSYVQSIYQQATVGERFELPRSGTPLENPFVYDRAASELKEMERKGLVTIVEECVATTDDGSGFVSRISFERVR